MGTYSKPQVIQDPLAGALAKSSKDVNTAAIQYINSVENQKKLDELKNNKLNESLYNLDVSVNSITDADDAAFDDNFKGMMQTELSRIHDLGNEALRTGDNSLYLKEKAKFESLVKKMPVLITNINNQAKQLDEKGIQNVLNNTDSRYVSFLDNWNNKNGSGTMPKIVDGNLVLDYGGFNVNSGAVLSSVENGGGLTFVNDNTDQFQQIFKKAAGNNYSLLSKGSQYVQEKDGKMIQTNYKDYSLANKQIRSELEQPNTLNSQLNQNNWQLFGFEGTFKGEPEQVEALRSKVIERVMGFGVPDKVLTQYAEKPKSVDSSGSGSEIFTTSQKAEIKTRQKDYTKDFDQVKTIASLTSRSARKEALVKATNANAGAKGPVLKYKDGEIYKLITSGAKTVEIDEPLDINVGDGGYYEMQSLLNDYRPDPISSEVMGYFRDQRLGHKTSKVTAEKQTTQEVKNNNDPAGLGI